MRIEFFFGKLIPGYRSVRLMAAMGIFICSLISLPASSVGDVPKKSKAHIVFLISEDPDNYEAHRTIPAFAEDLRRQYGFKVTVLLGRGPRNAFAFPDLAVLRKADLLVVFCRRVALIPAQLDMIRKYLRSGRPLVGLRTANHAFSVREELQQGHQAWWEFVPEILGCENKGYGPVEPGTAVSVNKDSQDHPVLAEISRNWHSNGNLYLVSPLLDRQAVVLLYGTAGEKAEPIAWTRITSDKSRVFYTSLGHPDDFGNVLFRKLFVNGIHWTLSKNPR